MSDVNTLKNIPHLSTLNFVLLTLVTAGVYLIVWQFMNTPKIEKITSKGIADHNFLVAIAACFGLSGVLSASTEPVTLMISGLLSIALFVLYIIWAFKAKVALQGYATTELKVDLRMNGIYTFLFTVFYINYCINEVSESDKSLQAAVE
ncbi:hypothetical protein CWB96_08035 [Pseudoalteromonas citrea]|uniref:DUF4234 domain-containing protein n=1 Tax=Pseudoalteromonas citrea TaxID=43655 RepID=A0A5S3XQQ1_9GAMM|nr:DUF4234 domain-containing protein [Pseudoalteromonas citrea]TMP37826.1 hypothetical protein CWB97_22555 [Pseudoalteromonas citrea]TMP59970.1 hypothetical protein CWB96_08035 [Pseudoalteromonas citrea]